jgi:hypothetical protein
MSMKNVLLVLGALAVLGFSGCNDDDVQVVEPSELVPPLGLYSITGDEQVILFWWCSNYGDDLVGFKIYQAEGAYSLEPREEVPAGFAVADSVVVDAPCGTLLQRTIGGLVNGTTYSFLVVAAKGDEWREISHTSNITGDTPRQESDAATEIVLYAKQENAEAAGFELSDFTVVDCSELDPGDYTTPLGLGDIMCEKFGIVGGVGDRAWLDGINGAGVQCLGFMQDWNDADQAPLNGYADPGHSIEALMGHVYAIATGDGHYAKVQLLGIDDESAWVRIKAAYQPQWGNPEYK